MTTTHSLSTQFTSLFNTTPTAIARAPGRVNLVGDHTDYNDGYVCPIAINLATSLIFRPHALPLIRLHSLANNESTEFPIDQPIPKDGPPWSLYPKGVVEKIRQLKTLTHGFDAVIDSNIPLGAGLSSSAALEVATALALLHANNLTMPPVDVALACQWAEHNYPGTPCGIMDQFISVLGQSGHALLLDCRDRSTTQIPLNDPDIRIVVSNTNVKHELASGEYAKRRAQCEQALAILKIEDPSITSLRDVVLHTLEHTPQFQPKNRGKHGAAYWRAHHVITENKRTLDFAVALQRREFHRCGRLMNASHESLRDYYFVSCDELDELVRIARTVPGVYGARMTGGGFGGSIVALCTTNAIESLTKKIALEYPQKFPNKSATTFTTTPSAGASILNLLNS